MKLFPTPTTRDYKDGRAQHRRNGIVQDDTVARCIVEAIRGGEILLPTPKALDGIKGNLKSSQERIDSGNQVDLPNVAIDLISDGGGSCCQPQQPATGKAQTCQSQEQHQAMASQPLLPTTRRSMGNASQPEVAAGDPKKRIENTVLLGSITWGKFAPAIERWENVLGRPAPAPTKPDGRDGAHRLSSEFTEWMMGLPAGWVTDCGLTRNEELKACGNGVVPQQAELALRFLLQGIPLESAGGGQVNLPTPTVSDTFTDNLSSTQQKPGSMHSVTLPQAVRMVAAVEETN